MLSIIYSLTFSSIFMYWGTLIISFTFVSLLSVMMMVQNFTMSFNMLFSSTPLSSLMVLLSIVLCFLSIISTPSSKSYSYQMTIHLLTVFLVLAFSSSNMINFYVWFEASLIPTLVLIICWGYQPERLQAGSYMMLYTVGASLPLLIVLIWRCFESSSSHIFIMSFSPSEVSASVLIFIYGAFLVKLPMYGFHLWLPKAHVEAPLAGSMILAGILLKLGGFGLFQMNKCFSLPTTLAFTEVLVGVSVWGSTLAMMLCLRQVDVKAYVAYSSVGHMGLVTAGVLMDRTWGASSALITMVAHGFTSSALFCLAYFTYVKSHSRAMPYMKGILKLYPMLSLWWFTFCCVNMSAPPTINLMGEIMVVVTLWYSFSGLSLVMMFMVFLSACYNMHLYSSINHGDSSRHLKSGTSLSSYEMVALAAHLMPLIIIFKSSVFLI
uniref:NADH-ubiquinone oxidoreductase chain 4 n=1 Tax=Thuridilla gracilis TaxID=483958 RepID=E6Y1G8_9GAST|nr:NADH dehydrogenase subunit 4 [Thuridilla gracilis]